MDGANKSRTHLIKAKDWQGNAGTRISHTLNDESELFWVPLSDRVGMVRAQLAVGRIPPGKESFDFHAHSLQEEFIFILSGEGEAEIGDETHAIGPGDYMGFPIDGTAHNMRNTGEEDLVYLMGGERTAMEVAHFPRHGKTVIFGGGKIQLVDDDAVRNFTIQEWAGNPDIPEEK